MRGFRGFRRRKNEGKTPVIPSTREDLKVAIYRDLEKNHRVMKDLFERCYDVNFRIFRIGKEIEAEIIYVDNMAHFDEINTHILTPLMRKSCSRPEEVEEFSGRSCPPYMSNRLKPLTNAPDWFLPATRTVHRRMAPRAEPGAEATGKAGGFGTGGEPVIRGPKEGFIESAQTNTALLRRRIQSPQLKLEEMRLGRYTQTRVIIAYMEGIVNESVLDEVKRRHVGRRRRSPGIGNH